MAKRVRNFEVTSPVSRLALLTAGIAVILALTGTLSWLTRNTLQNMAHRFVVNISGSTAQLVEQHFQAGRRLLEELTARAESNRLAVEPPEELVRYLADRLRYTPGLAWVSYSYEKDGRFVGAWRQLDGTIVLNTSHPDEAGGRPVERVIQPDGKTRPLDRKINGPYDPRTSPWYKAAAARHDTCWQTPFMFNEGRLGITAARALRDRKSDEVRGVFTADYFTYSLSRFLSDLHIGKTGKVLLFDRELSFCLPHDRALSEPDPLQDELRRTAQPILAQLRSGNTEVLKFTVRGQTYLVALQPLQGVGEPSWVCALVVPEVEVIQVIHYSRAITALIITAMLLMLLVLRRRPTA